jgi:hypothetical protein
MLPPPVQYSTLNVGLSLSLLCLLVVKAPESLTALQAQAKKAGTDTLTLEEIEAEIAAIRQEKFQAAHESMTLRGVRGYFECDPSFYNHGVQVVHISMI